MPFLGLPNEVIGEIIEYLKQEDIYSFIQVNRLLHFRFFEHLLRYEVVCSDVVALLFWVPRSPCFHEPALESHQVAGSFSQSLSDLDATSVGAVLYIAVSQDCMASSKVPPARR